jgi:hypothetical protein
MALVILTVGLCRSRLQDANQGGWVLICLDPTLPNEVPCESIPQTTSGVRSGSQKLKEKKLCNVTELYLVSWGCSYRR